MMSVYNIYYYIKTNNPNKRTNYVLSLKNINIFRSFILSFYQFFKSLE